MDGHARQRSVEVGHSILANVEESQVVTSHEETVAAEDIYGGKFAGSAVRIQESAVRAGHFGGSLQECRYVCQEYGRVLKRF